MIRIMLITLIAILDITIQTILIYFIWNYCFVNAFSFCKEINIVTALVFYGLMSVFKIDFLSLLWGR